MNENFLLVIITGGIGFAGVILGAFVAYWLQNQTENKRDRKNFYEGKLIEISNVLEKNVQKILKVIRNISENENVSAFHIEKEDLDIKLQLITNFYFIRPLLDKKGMEMADNYDKNYENFYEFVSSYLADKKEKSRSDYYDAAGLLVHDTTYLMLEINDIRLLGYKRLKHSIFKNYLAKIKGIHRAAKATNKGIK